MNKTVAEFIRKEIKKGLKKLPEGWQGKFKRMYGNVNMMPDNKLDWALTQVQNSLKKQLLK